MVLDLHEICLFAGKFTTAHEKRLEKLNVNGYIS